MRVSQSVWGRRGKGGSNVKFNRAMFCVFVFFFSGTGRGWRERKGERDGEKTFSLSLFSSSLLSFYLQPEPAIALVTALVTLTLPTVALGGRTAICCVFDFDVRFWFATAGVRFFFFFDDLFFSLFFFFSKHTQKKYHLPCRPSRWRISRWWGCRRSLLPVYFCVFFVSFCFKHHCHRKSSVDFYFFVLLLLPPT